MLFVWGRRGIPLGLHSDACGCGGKIRLTFVYSVFGLFWLGFATGKELVGECNECGSAYTFNMPARDMDDLISWNYRYGWIVWVAIIGLAAMGG